MYSALSFPTTARVTALLACLSMPMAWAVDLGVIGPTYPIAEHNLLDVILARVKKKEASGELQQLQDQARERAIESVSNPRPVAGLTRTETRRTDYFDPSFTLDRNVLDSRGRLLYPAGLRKNPLEVISLSKQLLFFDGRDALQVERARGLMAYYPGRIKPILVGGSYVKLMRDWKQRVYYDQYGTLSRRLGIKHVPALVSQEGLRLRIDELEVKP